MQDTIYLVLNQKGVARFTKRKSALARNEIAVRLAVTVPDAAFRSMEVTAEITVPADRVIQPDVVLDIIEPEVS